MTNTNEIRNIVFTEEFEKELSKHINIDCAKVMAVPQATINSFKKIMSEHQGDLTKVLNDSTEYGIIKLQKNRIVLFYVKSKKSYNAFIASEISHKRILNYVQYLKNI